MPWIPDSDVNAIHDNVAGEIAALTEKTTPVDADLVIIEDSEDSNAKKKVQLSNLGGGAEELDDLTDVDLSTPPTDGQVLKYDSDGSVWVAADDDTGSGSLPTAAAKGDIAVYDGDSWEILTASTTDGHVLTIDTGESLGLKWAAASGGGVPVQVAAADDASTRTLTTNNTWEDVSGASVTFSANAAGKHRVNVYAHWRCGSSNWVYHQVRVLLDSATTGVNPTTRILTQYDAGGSTFQFTSTVNFEVDVPDTSSHTIKLQSHDLNSSLDRVFEVTRIEVWGPA